MFSNESSSGKLVKPCGATFMLHLFCAYATSNLDSIYRDEACEFHHLGFRDKKGRSRNVHLPHLIMYTYTYIKRKNNTGKTNMIQQKNKKKTVLTQVI